MAWIWSRGRMRERPAKLAPVLPREAKEPRRAESGALSEVASAVDPCTDELVQDLIGSIRRLSQDEQRRKRVARKLF